MKKATITCPHCSHTKGLDVPEETQLAFYECEECKEMVSGSENEDDCACVICAHGDVNCPRSE